MAISDEVLNTAIEHIYVYESQSGELKGKDPIGGTESEFHMKVGIAKIYDESLRPMTQEQFDKTVSSERKRELAKQHVLAEAARMKSNGVDFNVLKTGESVALLSTLYNYGNQPNTTRCFSYLSEARKKRPNMTKEFEVQAMNSLDVTRADGEINMGIMQRSLSHQETFKGNLNVRETYKAKKDYTAQEQADLYADITSRSKECKSFADIVKKNNLLDDGTEIIYITEPTKQTEPPVAGFTEQPKEVVDINMFPTPDVVKGDIK